MAAYIKKYGEPVLKQENWDTNSHKNYYAEDKGKALKYGYLSYYAWWWIGDTTITIQMSGEDYEISTIIDYHSMSIGPKEADYSDEI